MILSGSLISALALPVGAQEEGEKSLVNPQLERLQDLRTNDQGQITDDQEQVTNSSIVQLNEVNQPATTVTDWIAQIEASLVQITGVRVETTETGLQVVLETAEGSLEVPETRIVDNTLIADLTNAAIAEEFSQADPITGIALVSVSQLAGDRVRVAVTGTNAPPVAEVTSEAQGLVLAVTLGDADAVAEEDEIEVVVTGEQDEGYNPSNTSVGTRTDTPLRDIPQSIRVIPQEVLQDQQVTRIDDALRNVPGVNAGTNRTSTSSELRLSLRGFSVSGFESSNYFRNGLRDPFGAFGVDLANIERIEVLKGPASVLFGRVSPAGTINLITKQPLRDPFYQIEATIGNYDFYRGAIDLSGPLNPERTVLYRLNASYLNREGFIDFFKEETFLIAPTLSWAISDRTNLTLEAEYLDDRTSLTTGLPPVGTVLPNPNGEIPRNRNTIGPDAYYNTNLTRLGYRLEHKFSDNWTIRNAFRVSILRSTLDDNPFPLSLAPNNRTVNRGGTSDSEFNNDAYDLTLDLIGRLSTGSVQHQLLFGVDLSRYQRLDFRNRSRTAAPLDLFNPVYDQRLGAVTARLDQTSLTDALGIYVQDQVTIADNLKLLLGIRFDTFKQDLNNLVAETEISQSESAFSPRVGIVYQPIPPISLYASYSRSFSPVLGVSFAGEQFQPERGTQYEVGIKADLTNRLAVTLALYDLTRSNVLNTDNRPGVPSGFSIQTGEQRSQGIEFDISGEILPGWNIFAGYAYTDARTTKDRIIAEGNRLTNIPEHAFSLWTTYTIQTSKFKGLGFGLGFSSVSDRQGNLTNTFEVPGYFRTDAAIFYKRDRFRASLNFRNLFDVDYFDAGGRNDASPGEPFTVQGTISYEF